VAGRRLTLEERQKIEVFRGLGFGVRNIAGRVGRCPSTVSRELRRPVPSRRSRLEYRALPAHIHAFGLARRRRPRKLVNGSPLRAEVARLLREDYSPGQIAG
jgi:IS30 family transposase